MLIRDQHFFLYLLVDLYFIKIIFNNFNVPNQDNY